MPARPAPAERDAAAMTGALLTAAAAGTAGASTVATVTSAAGETWTGSAISVSATAVAAGDTARRAVVATPEAVGAGSADVAESDESRPRPDIPRPRRLASIAKLGPSVDATPATLAAGVLPGRRGKGLSGLDVRGAACPVALLPPPAESVLSA